MKMSRRALRMQRNHKRNANKSGLNLTALMDIFYHSGVFPDGESGRSRGAE